MGLTRLLLLSDFDVGDPQTEQLAAISHLVQCFCDTTTSSLQKSFNCTLPSVALNLLLLLLLVMSPAAYSVWLLASCHLLTGWLAES